MTPLFNPDTYKVAAILHADDVPVIHLHEFVYGGFKIQFVLSNAIAGEPIDLTPPYTADDANTDPDISPGAEYKTVISYMDKNQYLSDVPWTIKLLGQSTNDNLLEEVVSP